MNEQSPPLPGIRRVCVFCGSREGSRPAYVEAARAFGRLLASEGVGVVYGGAGIGVMGALAEGALAGGGEVIGVIPHQLHRKEVAHGGLSALHVVGSMHERKAMMASLSDAFVALPGGIGTFEELFEVWTWAHLGIHAKPCALLDVDGYYQLLMAFIERSVLDGFLLEPTRAMLMVETDGRRLLQRLRDYRGPAVDATLDISAT